MACPLRQPQEFRRFAIIFWKPDPERDGMRISLARLLLTALLTASLTGPAAGAQEEPQAPPLKNLLSSNEWRDYQKKDRYKERMKVFRNAFERWEDLMAKQARDRQHEALADTLASLRHLSRYAYNEPLGANPKDSRAKKTKKLEIRLRKIISFLEDLKFQFPLEMRDDFTRTHQELEHLREKLLAGIFGQAFQPEEQQDAHPPPSGVRIEAAADGTRAMRPAAWSASSLLPSGGMPAYHLKIERAAPSTVPQRRRRGGVRGDQFTQEELDRIRLNQRLDGRVDVFLDIAESRLIEIAQRLEKAEYQPEAADEEDAERIKDNRKREEKRREAEAEGVEEAENPLLFFTLAQLAQAYERAIDGITVNVDDRFKRQAASEKDIRKVMKKLDKKAPDFLKQIEEFKKAAVEIQDEPFYRELLEAEEITQVAIKGSRHFLKGSDQ
ncbi:MAG TPA: hypothetical protein VLV83_06685 [Acidobacteriota bacterium]|nr:hypothetical protein [Acidobacteriota bacterium]